MFFMQELCFRILVVKNPSGGNFNLYSVIRIHIMYMVYGKLLLIFIVILTLPLSEYCVL